MAVLYYVQYGAGDGYLWVQLKPNQDFMCWKLAYASDAYFGLQDREAQEVALSDLPPDIVNDFDFNRLRGSVRQVFKLS